MKKILLSILLVLPCLLHAQLTPKGITTPGGIFFGFYEFKPPNYGVDPTVKYPLIISLHGIIERGNGTTELYKVAGQGIPKNISSGNKMTFTWNGKTESFLVLAPQCRKVDTLWYSYYIDEMINYAKKNLQVDTNRIILTGFSMGGGGVWMYTSASVSNSRKFAGIVPICAACLMKNGKNIADAQLPVYAFHALNDTTAVALPSCTINALDSIRKYNPVTFPQATYYPTGGHSIWSRAFDTTYVWQTPNVYEWMLNQDRRLSSNRLPVAITNKDTLIHSISGKCPLNAATSYDPDGTIIKYFWRQLSGPATVKVTNPTLAAASLSSMKVSGIYKYELKVTDNRAGFSYDTITIELNLPPVARAGLDQVINLPATSTTLNGTTSSDADGNIASYAWTKTSGPTTFTIGSPTSASTTLTNLIRGTYKFRLTVKDNKGGSAYDDIIIYENAVPIAKAGADSTLTLPKNTTTLVGSGSTDLDGLTGIQYLWEQISGPNVSIIDTPSKSVAKVNGLVAGTYSYKLTVTDLRGAFSRDTALRIVKAASGQANLDVSVADQDALIQPGLKISPNVSSGSVLLNLNSASRGKATIRVYSSTGSEMKRIFATKDADLLQQRLQVHTLSAGMYYVEIRIGKERWNEKFVKQ